MPNLLSIVLPLVGIVISAAVTAYLGRRGRSGNVQTSEAKDLWDTLRAELARLQQETRDLRSEVVAQRAEIELMRQERRATEQMLATAHEANEALLTELAVRRRPARSRTRATDD